MEELNEMDDYDSEDDNDWRPTAGKKKSKTAAQKGEAEEEGGASDDDDDDDDNEDDDNDDEEDEDEDDDNKEDGDENNSSSDSEKVGKKPKKSSRVPKSCKSSTALDDELTNDSMSQGKGNEVRFIVHVKQNDLFFTASRALD